MERMIIAATVSFGLGAFGYVLFRFFLLPIRRYGKIKTDIRLELIRVIAKDHMAGPEKERLRKLAAAISTCYHEDLPVYYRLQLTRRNERPIEASQMLLTLAGTRQMDPSKKKIDEILAALRLSPG